MVHPPSNVAPGSNPAIDTICDLSLLQVHFLAPTGFSPGTLIFPFTALSIPSRTCGHV